MSVNAQRKLEFPVVKNSVSRGEKSSGTRLKRVQRTQIKKGAENFPASKAKQSPVSSPFRTPSKRIANVPDELENNPLGSPSPTKHRKSDCRSPLTVTPRSLQSPKPRVDTPIRTSLAKKFAAAANVSEDSGTTNNTEMSPSLLLAKQDCLPYHQAKQSFHTAKPDRLIGRDHEMKTIREFLKRHMTKKSGGSLYISGAPGTGKTAVLTHLIDEMKTTHSCKTVYLNCMTLDTSAAVYSQLYTDITGKSAPSAKDRLRAVEKVLTAEGPSIVLVLDEIDQLDSKNQEILYTIFEWPILKKSRLILVGLANALDLTDRVLPRLQARLSATPQLINFAPYTREQICAILKDRIQDLEEDGQSVMEGMALQFCARKISAVAGDMRKALDVCRRAVELVERDVRNQRILKCTASASNSPVKQRPAIAKKIGVSHINTVLADVYGCGATSQQQGTIPVQQKLVVCSLLLVLKQSRVKDVTIGKLYEVYSKVCRQQQMPMIDQSEFQGLTALLEARGILGIKKGKETRLSKVLLKLNERELEHTMQDKVLMTTVLEKGIPKK